MSSCIYMEDIGGSPRRSEMPGTSNNEQGTSNNEQGTSNNEQGTSNNEQGTSNNDRFSTAFLASLIASLASVSVGFCLGYTSTTQQNMLENTTFTITQDVISWFASLIGVGALAGSMVGAVCVEKLGRKRSIMATSVFYTPGWCLISYATSPAMLYAGRLLTGVSVGISSLSVPIYIAEVASARLRGGLGSISTLGVTIGIFTAYLVGSLLSWQWTAMFPVILVAIMVILMSFMPETPRWLLAHNQGLKAIQELEWLRGPHYNVKEECFQVKTNLDQQGQVSVRDFLNPGLYRPLAIGAWLMIFQQFCGINAILFFAARIFAIAGFKDAEAVSLSVGGALVLATAVSCLIVDKTGRRKLLMIGGVVMFLCTLLLGVYYDIADIPLKPGERQISIFGHGISLSVPLAHISWLAVSCVIIYIIVFALGWGTLPWLLMSEIFPPRARGLASGIVTFINWLFVFLVTKTFNQMIEKFYEQGTFLFFSAFSLASFFFTLFFVPETKGKTLEEIEQTFTKTINVQVEE